MAKWLNRRAVHMLSQLKFSEVETRIREAVNKNDDGELRKALTDKYHILVYHRLEHSFQDSKYHPSWLYLFPKKARPLRSKFEGPLCRPTLINLLRQAPPCFEEYRLLVKRFSIKTRIRKDERAERLKWALFFAHCETWTLRDLDSVRHVLDGLGPSEGLASLMANQRVPFCIFDKKLTNVTLIEEALRCRESPDEHLLLLGRLIPKVKRKKRRAPDYRRCRQLLLLGCANEKTLKLIEDNWVTLSIEYSGVYVQKMTVDLFKRIEKRPCPAYISIQFGLLVYRVRDFAKAEFGRTKTELQTLITGLIERNYQVPAKKDAAGLPAIDRWSLPAERVVGMMAEWARYAYDGNIDRVPIQDFAAIGAKKVFLFIGGRLPVVADFFVSFGVKKTSVITEIARHGEVLIYFLRNFGRLAPEDEAEFRRFALERGGRISLFELNCMLTDMLRVDFRELLKNGMRPDNPCEALEKLWAREELFSEAGYEVKVEGKESLWVRSTDNVKQAMMWGSALNHCYRGTHSREYFGAIREGKRFLMWVFEKTPKSWPIACAEVFIVTRGARWGSIRATRNTAVPCHIPLALGDAFPEIINSFRHPDLEAAAAELGAADEEAII